MSVALWGYAQESIKVDQHNYRARRYGKPGTLTLVEWVGTLDYFYWRCAYCGGPYEVLEHFDAVELKGTTKQNCYPACRSCNSRKSCWSVLEIELPEYANRLVKYWFELNDPCVLTPAEVKEIEAGYWEKYLCRPRPGSVKPECAQLRLLP